MAVFWSGYNTFRRIARERSFSTLQKVDVHQDFPAYGKVVCASPVRESNTEGTVAITVGVA